MNTKNSTHQQRRGINIKLVLFLSILISLIVRQVFGDTTSSVQPSEKKVKSIQFSLDTSDEYRMQISVDENAQVTHQVLKRFYIKANERAVHQGISQLRPAELGNSFVEFSLKDGLKVEVTKSDATKAQIVRVYFKGAQIAEVLATPSKIISNTIARTPISYSPRGIIETQNQGPLNVVLKGREYARFNRSLERSMNFDDFYVAAVTSGSTFQRLDINKRKRVALIQDEDVANLRRSSTQGGGKSLPSMQFVSNMLSDKRILHKILPILYSKLHADRTKYVEFVTPAALNSEWLKEFTLVASALEHQFKVEVRLIAEVDTKTNPNAIEQLNKLQQTVDQQPYLVGFITVGSPESTRAVQEAIADIKRKVRPSLLSYTEDAPAPTEPVDSHMQLTNSSFVFAAKRISYDQMPEGLTLVLNEPLVSPASPCLHFIETLGEAFQ